MQSVAIIGGGFSGLMAAVHISDTAVKPVHIYIINSGNTFPRGIAYGTSSPWYLLNVRAMGMSAFPDQPLHFVNWLKTLEEYKELEEDELKKKFVPRKTYGDYLQSIWVELLQKIKAAGHKITLIEDTATAVEITNGNVRIATANNGTIVVNKLLLATGHCAPSALPFINEQLVKHPAYYANPWNRWEENFIDKGGDAFILGSGLTMVDAVLSLLNNGFKGKIYFNSRNGLLPFSHGNWVPTEFLSKQDLSNIRLSHLKELHKQKATYFKEKDQPSFFAGDMFRPVTQHIWSNWTIEEKQEFMQKHKAKWNVRRHRIAPEIHAQITEALNTGKLIPVKGRITNTLDAANALSVKIEDGLNAFQIDNIQYFFNCTGPQETYRHTSNSLIRSLLDAGHAVADELDFGLKVAPNFACIGTDGSCTNTVFATGCLIKGTYWETFAVPDLRKQVKEVSENIAAQLDERSASPANKTSN